MAMPKWAKIGIGCLVAVVVIAGLVIAGLLSWIGSVPRDWSAERSVVIEAPPEEIAPLVADLRKWPEWSALLRDVAPDLSREYTGAAQGAGAKMTWGNEGTTVGAGPVEVTIGSGGPIDHDAGRGEIEIVSADSTGIATRARYGREMTLTSASGTGATTSTTTLRMSHGGGHEFVIDGSIRFEPDGARTRVVWRESGSFGEGLLSGMLAAGMRGPVEGLYGDILEKSLEGLKRRVEGAAAREEHER